MGKKEIAEDWIKWQKEPWKSEPLPYSMEDAPTGFWGEYV